MSTRYWVTTTSFEDGHWSNSDNALDKGTPTLTNAATITLPTHGESYPPEWNRYPKHWRDALIAKQPGYLAAARVSFCTCPATNPAAARFCARCGGAIRKPSAALAWLKGAAVRPIKMAAAILMTPVFVGATLAHYDEEVEAQWSWWGRMLIPDTLKKILT